MVDGKPKVEWEPKVNRWTGAEIQAVLKGAAMLDGEWKSVEGATVAEKARRDGSPHLAARPVIAPYRAARWVQQAYDNKRAGVERGDDEVNGLAARSTGRRRRRYDRRVGVFWLFLLDFGRTKAYNYTGKSTD